jgi:methylated-DNA-[protein]-cysteine S-methyltransferase
MILQKEIIHTPLGKMVLLTHSDTVYSLDFADHGEETERKLQRRFPNLRHTKVNSTQIKKQIISYFEGDLNALVDIKVDPGGTPFQKKVWTALQNISVGETRSYKNIAFAIDCPSASRAVGTANSRNPIAIIIPCHRVIGSDGTLGGYAGGIERKRWLLSHERAR